MRRLALLAVGLLVGACHHEPLGEPPPAAQEQVETPPAPPEQKPGRVYHHDAQRSAPAKPIIEVMLDPRATAALTLETDGHVRLWDSLDGKLQPWLLPLQDPIWMTLARQSDGGFTVAVVDTSNGAQVIACSPVEDTLRAELRFAIAPLDPQLELHVLDGGERILALGVDHRLRLYDLDGRVLSEIDERGFVPWQLRLSGGDGNEQLHLAVILTAPLRIQRVELADDRLRPLGDAHEFALDRGPNRNDLALSSDGRFAAALRRHKATSEEWSVELIELETGERKLIAGKLDTPVRARMHMLPGHRMLLESGSGRGFLVDLEQATPLRRSQDADPDGRFALSLARSTEHPSIELAAGAEDVEQLPEFDTGLRMHASVVGRTRAGFDAVGRLEILQLPER
jgi:hypothetical protein